jgi:PiT family inorganic phosphate transporter
LALLAGGVLPKSPTGDFEIPIYVIVVCALTMASGTMSGGWKIIRTMGSKIIRLKPIHGFAAETSAASIILTASHFGIPLSTTHVISSSIMGVGSTIKASAVKWSIVSNIVWAWVLTIPVCMTIACGFYSVINFAGKVIFHI